MAKLRLVAFCLMACAIAIGFSGCRLFGGGEGGGGSDVLYVGPTGSVSGEVSLPSTIPAGSLLAQAGSTLMVDVWLEEDAQAHFMTISVPIGGKGKYLFTGVKVGNYHVRARYRVLSNGVLKWVLLPGRDVTVTVVARGEPTPAEELPLVAGTQTGIFRPVDLQGNALTGIPATDGVTFLLWGVEFPVVVVNGLVETPAFPDAFTQVTITIVYTSGQTGGTYQQPVSTSPVPVTVTISITGGGVVTAQDGMIAGHVYDNITNQAVEGALVGIIGSTTFTVTDATGYFALTGLASGIYDLSVQRDGYSVSNFYGIVLPR